MKFSRRSFMAMPLVAVAACKSDASVLELTGQTMGTSYRIVAIDPSRKVKQDKLKTVVEASLSEVNTQMSNWDAGSEVSRFNASGSTAAMPVSAELAQVVQAALDVNRASDGLFDITVGPLIDVWGFGAAPGTAAKPSDAQIAAALGRTGMGEALSVEGGALRKSRGEVQIYLSAIGKGHGVDRVAAAVAGLGLKDFMVEIGGDLYTAGLNADGTPWQIGVETPDPMGRSVLEVVSTSDLGMATSGDYRNYFEADGVRYSHVIDPRTGSPIAHATTSATVLTDNAMLADAWATAMLVLGRERGLEIAEEQGLAVLFVERDGTGADAPYIMTESQRFAQLRA